MSKQVIYFSNANEVLHPHLTAFVFTAEHVYNYSPLHLIALYFQYNWIYYMKINIINQLMADGNNRR